MQLIPENDPRLKQECEPYDFTSEDFESRSAFVHALIDLMVANRGVGLAAPQVGKLTQLFVIDDGGAKFPCYNPSIVETSQNLATDYEGCLSFQDLFFKVTRPDWIIGQFQDLNGNVITRKFDGLAARCYQHELEHLQGICFISKVGPLALQMAQKRRIKHRKTKR